MREKPVLAPRVSGKVVMGEEVASQKSAPMTKYNTNLAAEFYVLSMLHRLGADAVLTVSNKKSVDILINSDGFTQTLDVEGVASRHDDWPFDSIDLPVDNKHFFAFVRFEGRIADPEYVPKVWFVLSSDLERFIKRFRTRSVVARTSINEHGRHYLNGWHVLGTGR